MAAIERIYESPPGSGSNNGAIPTQYLVGWNTYTNLTSAQILAFQAFPQDLIAYIALRRWQKEICSSLASGQVNYITLPTSVSNPNISGLQLTTDMVSQQKIAGVKQGIDNGTITITGSTFPFLAVNGVAMLSASDITALYGYVVRYVQNTYEVAANCLAQVNAVPQTLTTRAAVDSAFAAIAVSTSVI